VSRVWERFLGEFGVTRFRAMELITILNRCHRFRGFVYQHAHFSTDKKSIEVAVRPREGSAAVCSRCHLPAPGYDHLAERALSSFPCGGSRLPSIHHAARRL
jgi:transposase